MWFGNRNNFSTVAGLTHLSWCAGFLFKVHKSSHYIGSSASLSSSPAVTQSLHAWGVLACFTIICTEELELILAVAVVVTAKPSGKRTMLRILLNQEETTQELQYGQLFTRKGLSCVNWQWGPACWRCPVQRREEQRRILNRRAVVRDGSSRSVEQRTQAGSSRGRGRPGPSGHAFTRLRLGPAGSLLSSHRPPSKPNWFWKVLENLKCWLLVF